jgi:uncharacterized protein
VVIINGARQVGKSTLAERVLHAAPRWQARFLDDPQTRLAAESDPVGFLDFDGLMLIDEVQRVPGLWLAIKNSVDRDPRPGRFILTGSARLLAVQGLPDALPGRSETIELWPLSQGEIDSEPDGFVDAARRLWTKSSASGWVWWNYLPLGASEADLDAYAVRHAEGLVDGWKALYSEIHGR